MTTSEPNTTESTGVPARRVPSGGRIELTELSKWYGELQVVKDLSLTIEAGEFFSLLGPSGCGKTTTLRLIGGFEPIETGLVRIDGADMRDVPPEKRPVNTVFQSYALFPHQTVAQNVAFGLRFLKVDRRERDRRVAEALELVRLTEYGARKPHQLSGGQQQRVALARSLVLRPKVLLLDEPLGALDAKLRRTLQLELRSLHQEVGITFVYVTHDQEEALTMSDRLAVMRGGEIEQVGTPREVYDQPANSYVADFLGVANLLPASVPRFGTVVVNGVELMADTRDVIGECTVLVRPERVRVVEVGRGAVRATVERIVFAGPVIHVHLRVGDRELQAVVANDGRAVVPDEGAEVDVAMPLDSIRVLAR